MTGAPLIRIQGLVKAYQALRPLRIADLSIHSHDRIVLSGLDEMAAEMFVYLVTGAALPDEGHVQVLGRDTRDIATDTEWLTSLDRFGIVTRRAVLLDNMSVAGNLALPLTLAIDPMSADVRARVGRDAEAVGLPAEKVDGAVAGLSQAERLRLHLARAVAVGPQLLMLEHPTAALNNADQAADFGKALNALSGARGFGWIAISEDQSFAKASGGTRMRLEPATGKVKRAWFGVRP